jgi:cytochrome c oxidase assembly factor CtaG
MAAAPAPAYHGPAELTPVRAFTSWTVDLPVLALVLLAAGLYLAGARRMRRVGEPWPAVRTATFLGGGLGVAVIATMSSVGVYQGVLFYIRSLQTILLLLVAPLFLAMGRPLTLAIAALPRAGPRIAAAIRSRPARILTFPAITAGTVVVVPFLLYFSPWYGAGLHSGPVRELTFLALSAAGFVFFWTLLRVDPVPKAYPYLVSLWVTAAEVIGDVILGLAVIADQHLISGASYQALARPWGPSPATDQVLGGGTLWVLGDIVGLPFLAAQLIQMIREDEGEAVRVDAELDAQEAARAAAAAGQPGLQAAGAGTAGLSAAAGAAGGAGAGSAAAGSAGAGSAGGAGAPGAAAAASAAPAAADRPWWESDPRFADRFRPPAAP